MTNLGEKYSLLPIQSSLGKITHEFFTTQQKQLWVAHEIELTEDRNQFPTLPKRYQELYMDLLSFFSPGDGLVCENVSRFIKDAKTFEEAIFFVIQQYIEVIHAESYGMAITSVIKDPKEVKRIVDEVDNNDAVKAKADFLKKYIESDISEPLRFLAAACTEGIFFVTLFAIIFYFRSKNMMNGFIFLNEQVAKDETLHRDYYCMRVERESLTDEEREIARNIVIEAVEVEIKHLSYILRIPVDSVSEDNMAGLTIDNLSLYAKSLGNEILIRSGLQHVWSDLKFDVPWLKNMGMSRKTNFYEGKVGSYRNGGERGVDVDLSNVGDVDF